MIRCKECVMPNTRPDTPFVDGVCSACINFKQRPTVDWKERHEQFAEVATQAKAKAKLLGQQFDCIVPSSGGKDSTAQVMKALEFGLNPLVITATTCHLTPIGRENIDNLARHATTWEISPNRAVRAKLNRIGMRMVGDISWPEHAGIFTTPFRVAAMTGITTILYGENPQNQYGGPEEREKAAKMGSTWASEFGGFLGLRAKDIVGIDEINAEDMQDYQVPASLDWSSINAIFLGHYFQWDSRANAEMAKWAGMRWFSEAPSRANWWPYENLDNAQTGIHDHQMYRKYGYGRLAAQLSVDIRHGKIGRDQAMELVRKRDGLFPYLYAGVSIDGVLNRILDTAGSSSGDVFEELLHKFTNWDLFAREEDMRPILKEFA